MRKRLFAATTLLIIAALVCSFAASVYSAYRSNLKIAKDTVMEITRIYARLYGDTADIAAFVSSGDDTRVTVISPAGRVLADSRPLDTDALENHLTRPEIQAAADGSPAAYVRYSDTLGSDYIYYALPAGSGERAVFIRAAIPVAKMDAYLIRSLPLLILLLLAVILLCFAFSRGMIGRLVKPFTVVEQRLGLLSSGEYASAPVAGTYEEIDAIVRGIDEVAQVLQSTISDLRGEKAKLDYVLRNIGDGLLVLDENKLISLINAAALRLFHASPQVIGKSLHHLSNHPALVDTVRTCASHKEDALCELSIHGRIFLTAAKWLPDIRLTMVVLSDVTENRENAKLRETFFANASHELKTPLTAIKGFNELSALHNKDAALDKYIESIARETDRMLSLIGDMLQLSELETTKALNPVSVSLAAVAAEVLGTLSPAIAEKAVTFEIEGDAMVSAEPAHIYELMKNLMENAVRYNHQGGRVAVTLTGNGAARLVVSDNGIGISPDEQARIFERFYRVEKSRSQRGGGTGLGLSIVKHICALYGWELSLTSRLGVGTDITVVFGGGKRGMSAV